MRINSAFTGFFTNLMTVRSSVTVVMLAIFFTASAFTEHSGRTFRAKQVNLFIRQIGDRLLLQAGDSTSLVLPVTEIKDGTFLLRFENEFVFNHDSLMVLAQRLLPKTQFPSGYTVTVHDCSKGDIVYGFQLNNTSPDILACKGRTQPSGCYTIEFDFPDLYKELTQEKTVIDQLTESMKADPREVNTKLEELKTTALNYDVDQRNGALKPVSVHPWETRRKYKEINSTIFGYPLSNIVYGGMLLLLVVTLCIGRFWKISKPLPVQDSTHRVIQEPVSDLPALGKFLFNVKGQRLLLGSQVISLTDKECKVLELLHKSFGELISRETLMQEIWINEGVITGRSLDMFISKLRKKLSADPDLRITNIHGKGYRLETIQDSIT